MDNKINVLFLCSRQAHWIAGVYYIRNMILQLMESDYVEDINFFVQSSDRDWEIISNGLDKNKLVHIDDKRNLLSQFIRKMRKTYVQIFHNGDLAWNISGRILKKYDIDVIFPLRKYDYKYSHMSVHWIPDFQHCVYPSLFSETEIQERENLFSKIISANKNSLILSSQAALADMKRFYRDINCTPEIVHFTSFIDGAFGEKELNNDEKYFAVANQFWMHKNHLIVIEAIRLINELHHERVVVKCTGELLDYRNPKYTDSLKEKIKEYGLEEQFVVTGFLPREEQICLLKESLAIIQPSKFEGWSTVVEDGKTLGKTILLSDIPVHNEQKTNKCIMFNPENAEELAEIMYTIWSGQSKESPSNYVMKEAARENGNKLFMVIKQVKDKQYNESIGNRG